MFGAGDITSDVNHRIPAFIVSDLTGICTGNLAAGSTVNEYKSSLQLPGTHLGIHRAATHLLFIKHSLMYLESMKLSGVPGPIGTQGLFSIICILSLLYMATKLIRHEKLQVRAEGVPPNLDGLC